DRNMVEAFFNALFRYANPENCLSLRAFSDVNRDAPPLLVEGIKVGDPNLINQMCTRITEAAQHHDPFVFCPPICTFSNPFKADDKSLAEGVALSVDLDSQPRAGQKKLCVLLGRAPTAIVASGGVWLNPRTGQTEPMLHLHWRLKMPTRTK